MKKLTLTLEEEISFLDKYAITPNELLVLRVLLLFQDENNEELLHKLLTTLKRVGIQLRDILLCLQDKMIILKSYQVPKEGDSFDPLDIPINKNFIKQLYKCSFELGKELFEAYPQFGVINSSQIPLRTVAKHFDSLEQCYFKYSKAIGWNPEKHNKIIELVNWARENNILNMSLSSFVINQSWLDLEVMKEGDAGNINYNTIREL